MNRLNRKVAIVLLGSLALSCSALAARQTHTAKSVAAVTVVTEDQDSFFNSTSFQEVGRATITVPAGKVQLVQAAFTASSECDGTSFNPNFCYLRILADGQEMSPAGVFAFDSIAGTSDDYFEAHAIHRSMVLGPGAHTIQVQAAVSIAGAGVFLDHWSLTVTQYNNGR
jgi:hypothetical protein